MASTTSSVTVTYMSRKLLLEEQLSVQSKWRNYSSVHVYRNDRSLRDSKTSIYPMDNQNRTPSLTYPTARFDPYVHAPRIDRPSNFQEKSSSTSITSNDRYFISLSDHRSTSFLNKSQTTSNTERTGSTPDNNRVFVTYYMIVGSNENEEERKKRRRGGFIITWCCCCAMITAVIATILLAALIAAIVLLIIQSNPTTSTVTSTTSTTATTTTSTSTTTSTTSTSTTSTTSTSVTTSTTSTSTSTSSTTTSSVTATTSTTSTTTTTNCIPTTSSASPYNSCNDLHWDQTGVTAAGTTEGSAADELKNPSCLYIDGNDVLYICDTGNNRIQSWLPCATSGITVAGSDTAASGSTATLLHSPQDVAFDKDGYIYVADYENHRVQRFTLNSTVGTTVAGTTTKSSALTDLDHLTGIVLDNDSNIYVLDNHNKRVIEWAPNATSGTVLISDNDINGAQDILLAPGSSNQVYISDTDGDKISLWTFGASSPDLTLTSVSGSPSTLKKPAGIVFDPYGNLYVADTDNNRVVMYCVNSTTGIVVVDSSGLSVDKPSAVALDSNLNMYVSFTNGDLVIRFPRQ